MMPGMVYESLDQLIKDNTEVGSMGNHVTAFRVLACLHCGAFLWDVEKHMERVHSIHIEKIPAPKDAMHHD